MLRSFVDGVTPDGKRHPLFVGTIGAARSFADQVQKNGGVADDTFYQEVTICEAVRPTHTYTFTAAPVEVPKPAAKPLVKGKPKQAAAPPANPPGPVHRRDRRGLPRRRPALSR